MLEKIKLLAASRRFGVPRSELRFAQQMAAQDFFRDCDGIIDVGANQGMFTTAMAVTNPALQVHAFEPLPMLLDKLRTRVRRLPTVTIHPVALGAIAGRADLHFSSFHEASSLLPMDQRHAVYFPGSAPTDSVPVRIETLDDFFLRHPKLKSVFLKLDVQGFELEVLAGAQSSLGRVRAVLAEVSFEQLYTGGANCEVLLNALFERGFRLGGFFRPLYRPSSSIPISCDCLLIGAKKS